MRHATWAMLRNAFPYSLLVFEPRRELTIGEWAAIFEKAGYHLHVHVELNQPGESGGVR